MGTLEGFLSRNSVVGAGNLPLLHAAPAYYLQKFQVDDRIESTRCKLFADEKLNYFFVGRPAYKYDAGKAEGSYWEYPCCFIFEFSAVANPRRIFPFDSGAFKDRYPHYINMMDIDAFEVSAVPDAPSKIIGAFFGSSDRYFHMKPKPSEKFEEEFSLTVMDTEIKALHRLSTESGATKFDDRRLTVEVSSASDIDLLVTKPLALIAPSEYFDNKVFRDHVTEKWRAEPIPYPVYSLSVDNVYGQIYERIAKYFKQNSIL
ncbi:MAG: hypothetical protein ACJ8IR_13805 [Alphaproteobacteria bacterium]|jgi:hypothetical protein